MSYDIQIKLFCDGCKEVFGTREEYRKTKVIQTIWSLDLQAEKKGWITISRGMYNTQGHYCPKCADRPIKPIKKRKLTKE